MSIHPVILYVVLIVTLFYIAWDSFTDSIALLLVFVFETIDIIMQACGVQQ